MRQLLRNHYLQATLAILVVALTLFAPLFRGQLPLPGQALFGYMTNEPERRPAYSIFRDSLVQGYPYHVFAADHLRRSTFPLWNDLAFAGTPFFANGQSGVLSLTKAPWWGLPDWLSFNFAVVSQFLVASIGLFVLGRGLRWSVTSSVTAGLSFILTAPFVLWSTMTTISGVIAWLPWALWAIVKLHETLRWRWVVLTAIFTAAIWFGGHTQVALFCFVTEVAWALGWWHRHAWRRRFLTVAVSLILGVGLAAMQLVPFLEASQHAYREPGQASWSALLKPARLFDVHAKDWLSLATTISPTILDREAAYRGPANFIESNLYVGLIPLLLGIVALAKWRRRETKLLILVGGGSLLLILFPGWWAIAGKLFPPLTLAPVWRLSFIATFALAGLVGVGMESIRQRWASRAGWVIPLAVAIIGLWQWQHVLPFTPRQELYQSSPVFAAAQTGERLWPRDGGLDEFMVFGIPSVLAYDSVYPKSYLEFWQANANVVKRNQLVVREPHDAALVATGTNLVLSDRSLPPGWTTIAHDAAWNLARREAPAPLAHTVNRLVTEVSPADIQTLDLRTEGTVIGNPPVIDPAATTSLTTLNHTSTELALRVVSSGPTAVVTALQAYPGWRVTIDSHPAAASQLRVNHAFLGAAMNEGTHTVTFSYRPRSFVIGLVISGLSVLLLVVTQWLVAKQNTTPPERGGGKTEEVT
ncbi:MAG: YfhO family protein [Candidatus Kerfeldbacteria bacterium]|nr:YfhO family protein [Candidatus Kerfeldbacteria bacterium]